MKQQRGVTLIGTIFFLILFAGVALVGFKVVPFYIDYFTMKSMLGNLASEKTKDSDGELRQGFAMRASTNYLIGYEPSDLEIDRDHGLLTLTYYMERKAPLVAGVSLLMQEEAKASAPLK